MKNIRYKYFFDTPTSLSDKNLQKIIQFYLIECPVEGKSHRGLKFKDYGYVGASSFSKLRKNLLATSSRSLKKNYFPSKKDELIENFKKTESIHFPEEYCVFLKSDENSVIRSMFSAIRNAFAHGSFNVKSYEKQKIYYFSNFDKYQKAKIVLKEETLLSWIKIFKNK